MVRHAALIHPLALAAVLMAVSLGGCIGDVPPTSDNAATGNQNQASPAEQAHPEGAHEDPKSPQAPAHAHEGEAGPEAWEPWDVERPPDLRHTAPFPIETGHTPTLEEARSFTKKFTRLSLKGNTALETLRAEGAMTGNGTPEKPYVLDRFYVEGELSITNSNKSLILRNGFVGGQLRLNYIGESLYVHHVYAKDLRVNENIQRDGTNTGGLFHDNTFAFVGQIRHFIGEFHHNKIGPRPQDAIMQALGDQGIVMVSPAVVFNFDGFHGADVHDNLFLGQVDIKLHGHNHADCFTCPVHNHDDPREYPAKNDTSMDMRSRHSVRYASLLFRDNTIQVPEGIALRYNDRNHAGDDRTANSEPNHYLRDPHVHYQDITIRNNVLDGGYLFVDIFNALDEKTHPEQNHGILRIWDNEIAVEYQPPTMLNRAPSIVYGIVARSVDGADLHVRGNLVAFRQDTDDTPGEQVTRMAANPVELRGVNLETFDASNITMLQNTVTSGRLGVYAFRFTDSVQWILRDNEFHTDEAWRAKETKHAPDEGP